MLQKSRWHDTDATVLDEMAGTSRGQAPLTHHTAQQTSVYSVHSVVKNDSAADLPRRFFRLVAYHRIYIKPVVGREREVCYN